MALRMYSTHTRETGIIGNQVSSTLGKGIIGIRVKNAKQAPLNEPQKIHVCGFATLAKHTRYLRAACHVSMPPSSDGKKWTGRFLAENSKTKDLLVTEKIDPRAPVDPKKKATEEFRSVIDWSKVIMANGPLWKPNATVTYDPATVQVKIAQEDKTIPGAYAHANDVYYCLLYDPENHFSLLVKARVRGESGSTIVELEKQPVALTVHAYLFAVTANGKMTSPSYHSQFTVEAKTSAP